MTARRSFSQIAALTLFIATNWSSAVYAQPVPAAGSERVVLHTIAGDIVLALDADAAPKTVASVLHLARLGVYDSTHFARVDPLLVQMGEVRDRRSPLSAEQREAARAVREEVQPVSEYHAGMLVIARGDNPNGAEGAFAIVRRNTPNLDGQYATIGRVEQGMDVVERLGSVKTDSLNRPLVRLTIDKADVVESQTEVSRLTLHGAIPIDDPLDVSPTMRPLVSALIAGIALIALVSLASFFLCDRLAPRHQRSLNLIQITIGMFMIFMLQTPLALQKPLLGGLLFAALVGLFKLMSRFEA